VNDGGGVAAHHPIQLEVNGERHELEVEAGLLLVDLLRDELDLTGTHAACDTGRCGACTVHLDGLAVKSCMVLAVQADRAQVLTVEGLAGPGDLLHPLQRAFAAHGAVGCGSCAPGLLLGAKFLLDRTAEASEHDVRTALQGTTCGCAGYWSAIAAVLAAARGEA
jgi:aerobic carbon-monoxide dehydrogenase small subunit